MINRVHCLSRKVEKKQRRRVRHSARQAAKRDLARQD